MFLKNNSEDAREVERQPGGQVNQVAGQLLVARDLLLRGPHPGLSRVA